MKIDHLCTLGALALLSLTIAVGALFCFQWAEAILGFLFFCFFYTEATMEFQWLARWGQNDEDETNAISTTE